MSATIICLLPSAFSWLSWPCTWVQFRSDETWMNTTQKQLKCVSKICSKFTGEHRCWSAISIKLRSNFHITLKQLKLGLISIFSKYYFKTGTICLVFLSSHIFTAVDFDGNHFGILLWKTVMPRDHNEIKLPIGKIFRKYKPIRHYFVMSRK